MSHGSEDPHAGARRVRRWNVPAGRRAFPEEIAEAVIQGLDTESFLIVPHPKVREHFRRKADDYDRWLNGMRRLQASMVPLKAQS